MLLKFAQEGLYKATIMSVRHKDKEAQVRMNPAASPSRLWVEGKALDFRSRLTPYQTQDFWEANKLH